MPDREHAELLTALLRDVSRSFYLTLRVLPAPIRTQIGIAYLLARATDTIADTEIVPLATRVEALQKLRNRIMGQPVNLDFGALAAQQGSPAERELLSRINEAVTVLDRTGPDLPSIRLVLDTITTGQRLDLERFATATPNKIVSLRSDEELDDYTYLVAGCVGEFWTDMCLTHLKPPASINGAALVQKGIRFGKGLQLVNILRDIPADLKIGRCYLPEPVLASAQLSPADLTSPSSIDRFRPIYDAYLNCAEEHLRAGWNYTNALPFAWVKVRLACAWPILIGLRTIAHLRQKNPLDPSHRVKASRGEVKRLMAASLLAYPAPPLWRGLYAIAARA